MKWGSKGVGQLQVKPSRRREIPLGLTARNNQKQAMKLAPQYVFLRASSCAVVSMANYPSMSLPKVQNL